MKNRKKYLAVLGMGFLYSGVFLLPYIKYVFYDALIEASGFTNAQLGFTITAFTVAAGISTILTGWFTDRFNLRKLMLISGISHTIFTFLYLPFIRSYIMTLFIWFMHGFTSTLLFWGPVFKGVRMLGDQSEQGRLYGLFDLFNGAAGVIGSFGAIWIFSLFDSGVSGLKGVVVFYGFITILGTVLTGIGCPKDLGEVKEHGEGNTRREKRSAWLDIKTVSKLPQVWFMAVMIFCVYAFYTTASYFTPYCTAVLGLSATGAALFGSIRSYALRFASPLAGIAADKLQSPSRVLQMANLICAILLAIVVFAIPKGSNSMMIIVSMLMLLCLFNTFAKSQYYAPQDELNIPPECAGMAITFMSTIGIVIPDLVLPPIFGSWLDTNGIDAYQSIFVVMIVFAIIAAVASTLMIKVKKSISQREARVRAV